jgi:hypothetical protein
MSPADKWLAAVGFVSSFGAAIFWLWASVIPVPSDQDAFAVLQRISGINAIAAGCAAMASICAGYGFFQSFWG